MDGNQGIGRLRDWEIGLVSQSLSLHFQGDSFPHSSVFVRVPSIIYE